MATPSGNRRGAAAAAQTPATQSGGGELTRAAGASKYLADLPSRGLLSSTVLSSNLGGIRVYVCDHDTSPPGGNICVYLQQLLLFCSSEGDTAIWTEEQLIKTNSTNILIRSLQLNKQKSDAKDGKAKATAESNRSKRAAERNFEGRASAKKANMASGSTSPRRDGSRAVPSDKELQAFTVERLRALLKERGLPSKGKKDELILRLKDD